LFQDPDVPNDGNGVLTSRAYVHIKQRQFTKALADCDQVLKSDPTNSKAFLRVYQANLKIGNLFKAHAALLKTIEYGKEGR
jgi:tetratricopeptide (TPR) repeat protein